MVIDFKINPFFVFVVGLIFVALSLVAVAQADYKLACAKSELGIRWPSYESNSEYYVCPRLFAKQATVSCNPGEVFTFALQSCTSPSRYIPSPPLQVLPTASPLLSKPNAEGYLKPLEFNSDSHPPVFDHLRPVVTEIQTPEHHISGPVMMPQAPAILVEEPKYEQAPVVKVEQPIAPVETEQKPLAPLPPTPAPTPPVVEKKPAGKKPESDKKKKSSAKPSKNAKKTAAAKNPKKPAKNSKSSKNSKNSTKKTTKA